MNVTLSILAAAWTVFQIDPFYTKTHSRDAAPEDGHETTELAAAAAIGEIEAVSFMFRPDKAMAKLDLVPTDLKGPGGAAIPASAVDVRTVKAWWQDRERWTSYYNWAKYAKKNALLPDILLHDDALIRVDEAGTNNYLRMDYPEGARYVCVSEDTPAISTTISNPCGTRRSSCRSTSRRASIASIGSRCGCRRTRSRATPMGRSPLSRTGSRRASSS